MEEALCVQDRVVIKLENCFGTERYLQCNKLRRTKPKRGRDRPEKAGEIEINHQRSQITGDTVFLSKIYELSIRWRRQINLEF